MMRALKVLLLLMLCTSLSACAVKRWLFGDVPKLGLVGIQVIAEAGANDNNATLLDVVFVMDESALPNLPKSGPEWFEKKRDFLLATAEAVQVMSYEVPPERQLLNLVVKPEWLLAKKVFVFANYLAPAGQVIANVSAAKLLTIRLQPQNIVYESK